MISHLIFDIFYLMIWLISLINPRPGKDLYFQGFAEGLRIASKILKFMGPPE